MPFAFAPIRKVESGLFAEPDIPFSQFMSTALEQGAHDSMFRSIMSMTEQILESEGDELTPSQANARYGVGTLRFERPVREGEARLLNERKRAEMLRQYYLSHGNRDGLLSVRGISGIGAGFVGSILNPLDLSVNFLPIVGSEAAAGRVARLGGGPFRQAVARGIITSESLAKVIPRAPRLAESLIQGFTGNVVAEIPHVVSALMSKEDYTVEDSVVNVLAGTALGAALHLGVTSAARTFNIITNHTREVMFRKATDDFVRGKDTKVDHLVHIDDNIVKQRVKFREGEAEARAATIARASIEEVLGSKFKSLAVMDSYGRVHLGQSYAGIEARLLERTAGDEFRADVVAHAERGYVTQGDEFIVVDRARQEVIANITQQPIYQDLIKQGVSPQKARAEAMRVVRQQLDDAYFSRPDVEELVAQEQARALEDLLEAERQSYDEDGHFRKEELEKMRADVAEGKVATPEENKTWGPDLKDHEKAQAPLKEQQSETLKFLDEQIKALEEELSLQAREIEKFAKEVKGAKIEDVLKKLKIDVKGPLEGVTGMPAWLWNGAIDAVIAAIRAGKSIADAIEAGVNRIRTARQGEDVFNKVKDAEGAKSNYVREIALEIKRKNPEIPHVTYRLIEEGLNLGDEGKLYLEQYLGGERAAELFRDSHGEYANLVKAEETALKNYGKFNEGKSGKQQLEPFKVTDEVILDFKKQMNQALGVKETDKGFFELFELYDKYRLQTQKGLSSDALARSRNLLNELDSAIKSFLGVKLSKLQEQMLADAFIGLTEPTTSKKFSRPVTDFNDLVDRIGRATSSETYKNFMYGDPKFMEEPWKREAPDDADFTNEGLELISILNKNKAKVEFFLRKDESLKEKSATDMSRRTFINIVGKVTGAMGITPTSIAADLLKNTSVPPVKVVEKLLLPKLTLNQITDLSIAKISELENILHELKGDNANLMREQLSEKLSKNPLQQFVEDFGPYDIGPSPIFKKLIGDDPKFKKAIDELYEEGDALPEGTPREEYKDLLIAEGDWAETARIAETPLSELEATGKISGETAKQISSVLKEITDLYPDIAATMRQLMEPEAIKIATKEVDTVAKGTTSAVEAAVNCLTRLKI